MAKNLISEMKERIAKSGTSKKEVLYFAPDSIKRIRFLQELDTGFNFSFHSDFNAKVFALCKDQENHEDCDMCSDGIALLDYFAWSVWDYDANAVRILNFKATGVSPVPALIEMFEEFGTITDRDYKIKKVGKGTGGSFVVTPLDKTRFRDKKAKPYSKKQMEEIFNKAFSADETDEEDEEEEEEKKSKKGSKHSVEKKKGKKKEKSLREKFEDLDEEEVKEVAKELGMSKKEIRSFDEVDDLLDELFDNYEEEDLQDLYDNLDEDEEEDDDDDEED